MKTAAIVIGVNKTGYLPVLGGAVGGAVRFAQWAEIQGYSVSLITDDVNAVTLDQIRDEIRSITSNMTYQRLIVFFSGHGWLLGPRKELWLLSRAPDPETEAVNVGLSVSFARNCGIPHVVFISDSCRSGGNTHRHRSVTGGSIFPNKPVSDQDVELDMLYATRPGDAALEVTDPLVAKQNYKGIFTTCLLEALNGNVSEVIVSDEVNGNERHLITTKSLKDYMYKVVQLAAEEVNISLVQKPQIIPQSYLPNHLVELKSLSPKITERTFGRAPGLHESIETYVNEAKDASMPKMTQKAPPSVSTIESSLFRDQMRRILEFEGRDHFETTTGFSIKSKIQNVLLGEGGGASVFEAHEGVHIRVDLDGSHNGRSILVELEGGNGSVLAVKRGYIGTVLVEDDMVVNVNYTPSQNTSLYRDYVDKKEKLESLRAFAATASRNGLFDLNPKEASEVGSFLRSMKSLDPTLGIYASYAFFRAGDIKKVRNVFEYMEEFLPVPYDVWLLSRLSHSDKYDGMIAPFCPMMTEGWALIDMIPSQAEILKDFRRCLIPSLWTTFNPSGVALVKDAMESGKII